MRNNWMRRMRKWGFRRKRESMEKVRLSVRKGMLEPSNARRKKEQERLRTSN